jgi:hypothetical protein
MSNGRTLVNDIIGLATGIPFASVVRDVDLSELATLRRYTRPKVTWNVLMMRAYAIVCSQHPELNRIYVSLPWPHFYEHKESVCMMAVTRHHQGEERLFFARFNKPEIFSLSQLQVQYERFRREPIEDITQFRHQARFASMPGFVRRLGWWTLAAWPKKRAMHMGTFGMSLSCLRGAYGTQLVGPNTTMLGVDPMPKKGISRILFTFDHRVLDGKPATDMLESLYFHLTRTITSEVKDMLRADGLDPEVILGESDKGRKNRLAA